jgi:uncharacterized protein YoxC
MTAHPVDLPTFNSNVEGINTDTNDMTDGINKCVDKFNTTDWGCWTELFDSGTVDKIKSALETLVDLWNKVLAELAKLASPGNPFWFWDSSDSWLEVKKLLSGNTMSIGPGLPAIDSWSAPEARLYKNMPDAQISAITRSAGHADSLAGHLEGHGTQIINLWLDLGNQFVDYAQLVAGEVANYLSLDPTKWLDVVNQIVETVNNIIDFVQDLVQLVIDQWNATHDAMYALKSDFADQSGTVQGAWPSVENLS